MRGWHAGSRFPGFFGRSLEKRADDLRTAGLIRVRVFYEQVHSVVDLLDLGVGLFLFECILTPSPGKALQASNHRFITIALALLQSQNLG
jgi:hypothetical protein